MQCLNRRNETAVWYDRYETGELNGTLEFEGNKTRVTEKWFLYRLVIVWQGRERSISWKNRGNDRKRPIEDTRQLPGIIKFSRTWNENARYSTRSLVKLMKIGSRGKQKKKETDTISLVRSEFSGSCNSARIGMNSLGKIHLSLAGLETFPIPD